MGPYNNTLYNILIKNMIYSIKPIYNIYKIVWQHKSMDKKKIRIYRLERVV